MLRYAAALAVLGSISFCGSAASAQPPSDFTACEVAAKNATLEPIHFATDRPRLDQNGTPMVFDGDRPAFHGLVGFAGAPPPTDNVFTFGILNDLAQPVEYPQLPSQVPRRAAAPDAYASFA